MTSNGDSKEMANALDPTMVGLETKAILFLGDINTGKTSIIKHLTTGAFDPEYVSTVEECYDTIFEFEHKAVHLQIYDISVSEEYDVLKEHMMRAADGIVLVYNITQADSFLEALKLGETAQKIRNVDTFPVVLIGCMLDLQDKRAVRRDDGEQLALRLNCPFREISAQDRKSVVEVFTLVLREIRRKKSASVSTARTKKINRCCSVL